MKPHRTRAPRPIAPRARGALTEDTLALVLGLGIFALALASYAGTDLLGWIVTTSVWVDPLRALGTASKSWAWVTGPGALVLTGIALALVLGLALTRVGVALRSFVPRFAIVFVFAYGAWFLGSHALVAAVTPADLAKFGIPASAHLTQEGGLLIALVLGLLVGNLAPGLAAWLGVAIRPELYIKIAIVILGGLFAITAADKLSLASGILLRGVAAIVEAYLIYWAVVYFVARRFFGFNREWAAPLASGISICGVAAAIATGSAIRARPVVPVLVSSLVVVFAAVEVLVLPFLAQSWLTHDPLVAGAWLGLSVKTDGAAVASGGIAEALIRSSAESEGLHYDAGWVLGTATLVKVFIDIFIAFWTFLLAWIWTRHIRSESVQQAGGSARAREIWERFPKFILGFLATFLIAVLLATADPGSIGKVKSAIGEANVLRVIFFVLAFFSIGAQAHFSRLWADGMGKLVAVYAVSLFGFVIWVGLGISYLFFHGVLPPSSAG